MAQPTAAPASAPGLVPPGFAGRPSCPRCGCGRVHRWGRFSGRQRYRCVGCRRTFSTFTGTAIHYLKRIDCWLAFCEAMRRCFSVRRAAAETGLHKDTIFRWRHRILRHRLRSEVVVMSGRIAVGSTWLPYSYKGRTPPDRPPRRQRFYGWPQDVRQVWLVLARDEGGRAYGGVAESRRPTANSLTRLLGGRVAADGVLVGDSGPYSSLATCATRLGLAYEREGLAVPGPRAARFQPDGFEHPKLHVRRFRLWLRRFHGVATRYLDHYLLWFRSLADLADSCSSPANPGRTR